MWTPTSCSSAPNSSHSRSRAPRPWRVGGLVEQAHRHPRHLTRVLGPVVAALAQLLDAAAADVGVALDGGDVLPVAADVVEDQPFAQRQVAERDLLGAEPAQDRVEQHGAGRPRDRRGADRGRASAAARPGRRRRAPCGRWWIALARDAAVVQVLDDVAGLGRERDRAEAEDGARRADDPLVAARRRSDRRGRRSPPRCASPAGARRGGRSGSARTKRSVSRMTPILKLFASAASRAPPRVISTLPPPMSMTTARRLARSTP